MITPALIQVRFTDLDVLGHVNNNIYLSYFEMARVHYFRELLGEDWNWRKFTIVLAKNEVEYLQPVLLNHRPEVYMFSEHVGTKSFTLSYELKVNGIIFAKGKSVVVAFDGEKGISMEIPDKMRKALEMIASNQ
jgi:acyl-CoA thioester hydrolase